MQKSSIEKTSHNLILEKTEYEVSSSISNLSFGQKTYCIILTAILVLVTAASLFYLIYKFRTYSALDAIEEILKAVGGIFLWILIWKLKVYNLFHSKKVLGYNEKNITYSSSVKFTPNEFVPYSEIATAIRTTPNNIELQFKNPISTIYKFLGDLPGDTVRYGFETIGNEKDLDHFVKILQQNNIAVQLYPLGKDFSKMREYAVLILGLTIIFGGLAVFIVYIQK